MREERGERKKFIFICKVRNEGEKKGKTKEKKIWAEVYPYWIGYCP